jgi:glyoxylase I family protein
VSLAEIHSLDHTVLLCRDLARTTAFYRDVMGFPIEVELDHWVSFRVGGTLLTLRPRGQGPTGHDDGPLATGSAAVQLAFRVPPPAVDTCHTELAAHGVTIVRPPTDLPAWRHRTVFFRDPEDNLIEIYAEF